MAKQLGIAFYDYQLIENAAAELGLPTERVQRKEERIDGPLYALINQASTFSQNQSEADAIFEAQSEIIRQLASHESCVIVGRLGAYTLRERPNTFHIFLSADDDFRAERLTEQTGISQDEIRSMMKKEDNTRRSYCNHFTGKAWGLARHYHMCLTTSAYGMEKSLQMVTQALSNYSSGKTGK